VPRGGKRLGAGRKPHTRRERWLGGKAGHRPLALVPSSGVVPLPVDVEPIGDRPSVLTEGEAAYWTQWASVAQSRGMLHAGTEPGFVLLCKTARAADVLWACIESRGLEQEKVTIDGAGQEHREFKANSLLSHWRGLMARVEQLQARYGIAADGKVPVSDGAGDAEDEQLARLLAVK